MKKIPLPDVTVIVFDADEVRPACPLLQAAMGGNPSVVHHFDAASWLLTPTPGMKRYEISRKELLMLREKVVANAKRKKHGK